MVGEETDRTVGVVFPDEPFSMVHCKKCGGVVFVTRSEVEEFLREIEFQELITSSLYRAEGTGDTSREE